MTEPRWTSALTTVRADDQAETPRVVEGMAVPYEVEYDAGSYREVFSRGAFKASVDAWNARQDGGRLPFLSDHTQRRFLGGVVQLEDTPAGVMFRAQLRDTPDVADYLDAVANGANGVSAEFAPIGRPTNRNGVVRHAAARIGAIAAELVPAYDAARVATRGETLVTTPAETPEPEPTPEPIPEPPTEPAEPSQLMARRSAEAAAIRSVAGPVARVTAPELVYGPTSEHRFLRDFVLANRGDTAAMERQERHYARLDDIAALMVRAGDVLVSEIAGATMPTEYLPGLLIPRILKGRPLTSFFSSFPISDARARTYAKVTTSTTVAAQSGEAANPAASDFGTTSETVAPVLLGGETKVSRQVLDGADPAAEAMIMEDLLEAYAQATEAAMATATEATAIANAATVTATPHAGVVTNLIAYQTTRFQPAEAVFLPPTSYANLLKQADSSGRLLVPWLGPQNAAGTQSAAGAGASVLGVDCLLGWALTDGTAGVGGKIITGRKSDMVSFESPVARFSYDQVSGPAAIRLGLWAYFAANDRRAAYMSTTS